MKNASLIIPFLLLLIFKLSTLLLLATPLEHSHLLNISMQKRLPSELKQGSFYISNEIQKWRADETAIIICDMWDSHTCKSTEARIAEMAEFMNDVVSIARKKGVMIVHAPSDCMDYYKTHPAYQKAQKAFKEKALSKLSKEKLELEKDAIWPIDQSDGGCESRRDLQAKSIPWTHQIDLIEISNKDLISDSGADIGGIFYEKGIKNLILMGVHSNMYVIGRSFGLRNMIRLGLNVVLMRDMTDTMYNPEMWPYVDHFTGNNLMNEYVERYICPSIVSSDITEKKQFRFKNDTRKIVAFLTAESEYNSNLTLPEFANELLLKKGINSEFAIGPPTDQGNDRHNIENLQILEDADLAVIFVRRRGLEPEKMNMIRNYIKEGKPILGMRTASHAFDPKISQELSNSFVSGLAKWPEFDQEILGGNYKGHFNHDLLTVVSVVPGMENHPLLKNVTIKNFTCSDGLYRNQFLSSEMAQVLLYGQITYQSPQPILWTNKTGKNDVIYTSMGSFSDWQNENFRQIMRNSVIWLINKRLNLSQNENTN